MVWVRTDEKKSRLAGFIAVAFSVKQKKKTTKREFLSKNLLRKKPRKGRSEIALPRARHKKNIKLARLRIIDFSKILDHQSSGTR